MAGWWFFALTPLKNDGVISQWEGRHPIYEMDKKNVPNHQPDDNLI
jgi:hypothetical protein